MSVEADELERIFSRALELNSAAERRAYLDEACAKNAAVRQRVEALIDAHEACGDALPMPDAQTADGKTVASSIAQAGQTIGHYTLLEQIGEGGMGLVFVAEQQRPVRRRVALKVIRPGMDTREVIARFEAERQALALMDHPNIAKVLDAGTTPSGLPFFVMELVKGVPITQFCDERKLSPRQRLELFIHVCLAVQHAHQKGIIHRDLKPSNVLVTLHDGEPVVKVIDFGVAKAVGQQLTDKTIYTRFTSLIGTPLYMSPEQAELSGLDVDTRSDVYSLGALAYELLTGTTPFDRERLKLAAFDEVRRIIREEEPARPSTRLSTLGESLTNVSACRHTDPQRLGRIVRGELDWIVMKAMEKDRNRRYESASALAEDVRRYLADEPVTAAAPSAGYRLRKYVCRNKGAAIAVMAILAVLMGGTIGTTIGLVGQARQRRIAQQREREARDQAAISAAIGRFQSDMLTSADPDQMLGEKVTVIQVVMSAISELDQGKLKDQPLAEAGVRDTIANSLRALGRYKESEQQVRKGYELRLANLPRDSQSIGWSLQGLGIAAHWQGRLLEAEGYYREALAIYRKTEEPGHRDILTTLSLMSELLRQQGEHRLREAEMLARESVELAVMHLPSGHPDIAECVNHLALVLHSEGRFDEAEIRYREALTIRRSALPAGHPNIAQSLNNLAEVLRDRGKISEAEPLYRDALKIARKSLPDGHPHIAVALNNLGLLLLNQGKAAEAEPYFVEAVKINRSALSPKHPKTASSLNNLGLVLHRLGRLSEAEQYLRESVEIGRSVQSGDPAVAYALFNLGGLLLDESKPADAEPLFREAIAALLRLTPNDTMRIATSRQRLARSLSMQNRHPEAETELLRAEKILADSDLPPSFYLQCVGDLVSLYTVWDRIEPGKGHDATARQWKAKLESSRQRPGTHPAATQPAGK